MRTLRNLVGVVFVVAVMASSQARVSAYVGCSPADSWCDGGHMHYIVSCYFQSEWRSCNQMNWDQWNWCAGLANGLSYYLTLSCIGDDNPYGLEPTSGDFSCTWETQEPC